jgi:Tfp pilus assembly protein PilZ
MPKNRRKHTRVKAMNVGAQVLTAQGRAAAQLENISRGGAFVRTERPLDVGSDVILEINRGGLRPALPLRGRVTSRIDAAEGRHLRQTAGMGMQFLGLDPQKVDRLVEILHELGAPSDELMHDEERPPPPLRPGVRGGVKFELPRRLAEEVAGMLAESSPTPLVPPPAVAPPPQPSTPVVRPAAMRQRPPSPPVDAADETQAAKLLLQTKGLVMQLGEAQHQISQRDLEIERLKEELETAREESAELRKALDAARAARPKSGA